MNGEFVKRLVADSMALVVVLLWMNWRLDRVEARIDMLDDRIFSMIRAKK